MSIFDSSVLHYSLLNIPQGSQAENPRLFGTLESDMWYVLRTVLYRLMPPLYCREYRMLQPVRLAQTVLMLPPLRVSR